MKPIKHKPIKPIIRKKFREFRFTNQLCIWADLKSNDRAASYDSVV